MEPNIYLLIFLPLILVVIVLLTTLFLVRNFLKSESHRRSMEIKLSNAKQITPLKLQAYERMIMLLERIDPESLVVRVKRPGMSNKQLHSELLKTIRAEFEHNLSQQLYISDEAWEMIVGTKENFVKFINTTALRLNQKESAMDLSTEILEAMMENPKLSSKTARQFLKKEVNQIL